MGIFDKVKEWITPAAPGPGAAAAGEDFVEISFATPAPDASTCPIRFDRPVAPPGTALFETPKDAVGWPVVGALLAIPGVHSVISKGDVLIVAKRESPPWPELLGQLEGAVRRALAEVPTAAHTVAGGSAAAHAVAGGSAAAHAVAGGFAGAHAPDGAPEPASLREAPASEAEADLQLRVQEVIETEINPALEMHGGYLELLDVQGTRIFVHMGGGCQGCAMSTQTLKHGVETTLRARIPEISEVLDTTDHAAGANPYYQASPF